MGRGTVADGADNNLRSFRFECMPPSLITRNISCNKISTLTQHSGAGNDQTIHLPNLNHFDTNFNKLARLPSNIYALILQHIFLSQNKLEILSSHIRHTPSPPSPTSQKPLSITQNHTPS